MLYISDIAGAVTGPGGGVGLPSTDNAVSKMVTLDQVTGTVTLDFKTAYAYRVIQGEGDLTLEANASDATLVAHGLIVFERHPDYALTLGASFRRNPIQKYTSSPNRGIYALPIMNEITNETFGDLRIANNIKFIGQYSMLSVSDDGRYILAIAHHANVYKAYLFDLIARTHDDAYIAGNPIYGSSWGGEVFVTKSTNAVGNQGVYKTQRQEDGTFTSETVGTHYVRDVNSHRHVAYHPLTGGVFMFAANSTYRSLIMRSDGTKVSLPFAFTDGAALQFSRDGTRVRSGDSVYRTKYPQDLYPHRVIDGNHLGVSRFTRDGSRLLINEGGDSRIYTTSEPFGLLGLTLEYEVLSQGQRTFDLSDDGTRLIYATYNGNTITEATLSTAWDLSTAVDTGITYTTPVNVVEVQYGDGGQQIYLGTYSGTVTYSVPLTTAYDLNTAGVAVGESAATNNRGLGISGDGTRAFTTYGTYLYTYSMSTPWDLSTLTLLVTNVLDSLGSYFSTGRDSYDYMDPDHVSFCRRSMNMDGTKAFVGCRSADMESLIVEIPLMPDGSLDNAFNDFSTYFEEIGTMGEASGYGLSGDFTKIAYMEKDNQYNASSRAIVGVLLQDRCMAVTQLGTNVTLKDLETDSVSL